MSCIWKTLFIKLNTLGVVFFIKIIQHLQMFFMSCIWKILFPILYILRMIAFCIFNHIFTHLQVFFMSCIWISMFPIFNRSVIISFIEFFCSFNALFFSPIRISYSIVFFKFCTFIFPSFRSLTSF